MNGTKTAVFAHGAGAGGWEWAIWQRVFAARGWQTLAPDLRPCGAGLAGTRIEHYIEQVAAWCAAGNATVAIGASLGGLLLAGAASRTPPRALVLINPIAPAGVEPRPRTDYPDVVPWGSKARLDSTARAMPDADDAARLYVFRRWRDESGAVLRAAAAGLDLDAPRCSMLVLASERDRDVPVEASRALAQRWRADFRMLAGASHVAPLLGRIAAACAAQTLNWCETTLALGTLYTK